MLAFGLSNFRQIISELFLVARGQNIRMETEMEFRNLNGHKGIKVRSPVHTFK